MEWTDTPGSSQLLRRRRQSGAAPRTHPSPQGLALGWALGCGTTTAVRPQGTALPVHGDSKGMAAGPVLRLLPAPEAGMDEVLEEVYENQSRQRGGEWGPAAVPSTDVVRRGDMGVTVGWHRHPRAQLCPLQAGTAVPPKEEVACPQGWHVTDDWRVEVTGAVDEAGERCPHEDVLGGGGGRSDSDSVGDAGWEYGVSVEAGDPSPAWHPKEEMYHTQRRRRWLRTRRRDSGAQGWEQDADVAVGTGWHIWRWWGWGGKGEGDGVGGTRMGWQEQGGGYEGGRGWGGGDGVVLMRVVEMGGGGRGWRK